jgi:formyl-CoA transferase
MPGSTALSRFRVLDLTRVRAGPTCVRQFADWGADVIKVEMPEAVEGDGALGGPRHGSDFQNLHRNKRSLTLNLKEAEGVAIFKKLVENADVVVENYRPDVKKRLGVDYESLRKINKRIVYASISGFGQDGPYVARPGVDQIAQGMGGLMSITGLPGQGPVRAGIAVADVTAGMFAAIGVLTALHEREVSGEGQWVQTSLLQAQIFICDFQAARWTMDGKVPGQAGNNHPTSIPTGVFKCSDEQYINIATAGQPMWRKFCEAVGQPALAERKEYATGPLRSENREALNAEIQAIIETKPSAHWVEAITGAGVPCGPIYTMDRVFADPQVKHLGIAQTVHSDAIGRDVTLVGQPIVMSRTPSKITQRPPERGEHSDAILGELGYSRAQIDDLRKRNIV